MIALEAYAADCRVFGSVDLGDGRLTDFLNASPELRIHDARLESLADGHVVETAELAIARDELCAVIATGPPGDPGRRVRTYATRFVVDLGPYEIVGIVHSTTASDPLGAVLRRAAWVPLTDAIITYHRGSEAVREDVDILLVNRNLTSLFRAAEDRFPITHHREETAVPEIRGLLHEAAPIDAEALTMTQPRARDHGWQPRLGGDLGPRPAAPAGSPSRGSDHDMPDDPAAPLAGRPAEPFVAGPFVAGPPAEPPPAEPPPAEPPPAEPPAAEPPAADGRAFGPIAVGPIPVGPPDAGPIDVQRPGAGQSTVEHLVGLPIVERRAAGPIAVGPPASRRPTPTRTKAARATSARTKPAPTSPTTPKRATLKRVTPTGVTPTGATPRPPPAERPTPTRSAAGRATPTRSKAKRGKPTRAIRKTALVAPVPTAFCPYCALVLEPPPAASRRCPRCRQRIIVKRVEGRAVYLTEAALMVFDAERQRIASSSRLIRERERWLKLAVAAGAPAERSSRLAAAALTEKVVEAARTLYVSSVERAFRAAKRNHDWATASRIRREEAFALYRLAGSPLPPPTALVAMLREGVAAELRGIAGISRDAELVSAACCDICRADDGRIFRIANQLRVPRLPHEGCPKGLCRCGWDLAARDRTTMRRYMRRRSGTETRADPDEPATTA